MGRCSGKVAGRQKKKAQAQVAGRLRQVGGNALPGGEAEGQEGG